MTSSGSSNDQVTRISTAVATAVVKALSHQPQTVSQSPGSTSSSTSSPNVSNSNLVSINKSMIETKCVSLCLM